MKRKMCVRSFVPPILSHLKAHVWPSSNHRITFPPSALAHPQDRPAFNECVFTDTALFPAILANCIDLMRLSGNIGSILDMFHEQLPLPVPCYDLVLVIEFAVVLREAVLRAPPTPLT